MVDGCIGLEKVRINTVENHLQLGLEHPWKLLLLPVRGHHANVAALQLIEDGQIAHSCLKLFVQAEVSQQPARGLRLEKPLKQPHMHRLRQQILEEQAESHPPVADHQPRL